MLAHACTPPDSKTSYAPITFHLCHLQINLDSDDEEAKGSQESDEVTVVEPPASTAGPSEFDILSSKPARRKLVVDPGTQKMLDNNRRAMEELERAGELLSDGGQFTIVTCLPHPAAHSTVQQQVNIALKDRRWLINAAR